jgi:hypothetical protein
MNAKYYTIERINKALLELSTPRALMHEYTSDSIVDLLNDVRDELMQYYHKDDVRRRFEEESG